MKSIILILTLLFAINSYSENLIVHGGYIVCYDEQYEIPKWVTYTITNKQLKNKLFKRKNYFQSDPLVPTGSAAPSDYVGSGYDKGHGAPATIFAYNKLLLQESFYMSNMFPQLPSVNRGDWKKMELYVQTIVGFYKKIYVVSGAVVLSPYYTIGKNKIAVPQIFYKVIFDKNKQFICGFVILNQEKEKHNIADYMVSLNFIKTLTDISNFQQIINLNEMR